MPVPKKMRPAEDKYGGDSDHQSDAEEGVQPMMTKIKTVLKSEYSICLFRVGSNQGMCNWMWFKYRGAQYHMFRRAPATCYLSVFWRELIQKMASYCVSYVLHASLMKIIQGFSWANWFAEVTRSAQLKGSALKWYHNQSEAHTVGPLVRCKTRPARTLTGLN